MGDVMIGAAQIGQPGAVWLEVQVQEVQVQFNKED